MTEEKMQELLFSLAWYDASSYHNRHVKEILYAEYPDADFTDILNDFIRCKTMPRGKGCPR